MYYFGLHSYFICYPFITHKSMTILHFTSYCNVSDLLFLKINHFPPLPGKVSLRCLEVEEEKTLKNALFLMNKHTDGQ